MATAQRCLVIVPADALELYSRLVAAFLEDHGSLFSAIAALKLARFAP
jgi:hypothetical protein